MNFPAAHIVPGMVSVQLGVWIRQPPGAPAPFTQCGSWKERVHDRHCDDASSSTVSLKMDGWKRRAADAAAAAD